LRRPQHLASKISSGPCAGPAEFLAKAKSAVRPHANARSRKNRPANTSARPTLPRPSHPIPRFLTIMIRPSCRGWDGRACRDDLPDDGSEIFFAARIDADLPDGL